MLRSSPNIIPLRSDLPTVWGLDPIELHDRYWASRSVCVVRPGSGTPLPRRAELFLLADGRTLATFRLRKALEEIFWTRAEVIFVRLRTHQNGQYRESVLTDSDGRFIRFERHYGSDSKHVARLVLTRDRRIARLWQEGPAEGDWRAFRRHTRRRRRETLAVEGRFYDRFRHEDLDQFVTDLIAHWPRPSTAIQGISEIRPGVWAPRQTRVMSDTVFLGPTWIGAGRDVPPGETVLGPAALWDDVSQRPEADSMRWELLDPTEAPPAAPVKPVPVTPWRRRSKRAFDVAFALFALLVTLPLYPLIMLAIWLEDGSPFLFAHKRETLGGCEFPCLKFRSMRKDADRIKAELKAKNQSDGPQFFMKDDPRVTRVGRFLRKTNLDEIPQFINVLLGHMSVVGPRPSPRTENQCCPPWREARLSVRPGITGLWQVSRTRREGLDFQEWIKFDMEYVERANWKLDVIIILKTLRLLIGR